MLPNALPTLIITATTDIGGMMLELAALSFLGFGTRPPAPEWGYMLNEGRACMQSAPWMMIFRDWPFSWSLRFLTCWEIPCGIFLTPRRRRKMLELDHVTIAYGETQAVEDFFFAYGAW